MTISYWLDEAPELKKNYDAIIIGGGIAGLSTAYWLEKNNPSFKIALIDKAFMGSGASGRNAGFVTCGSAEHFAKLEKQFGLAKALEIWTFSEQNRELLKSEILQDQVSAADYSQTGSCTVAPSQEDWARYQKIHQTMLNNGLDVELIDEKYLIEKYGVRNFQGAIQYKRDGVIHPLKLLKLIQQKLKNTDFIFSEEVFSIQDNGTSVEVQTQKQKFSCSHLFVGLNAYTSFLFPEYKKIVLPQRGQIVVTEPLPAFVKGPCYLTKHLCYFRQLVTGELLVGGFRNQDLEAENTAFDAATEKIQAALTDFTRSYFQGTQNVKINYRWSGIMGFTPDGQMMLGRHPQFKNISLMAGCSGHGMGLSFNAARQLVDNFQGAELPSHLDITRFKID